jgi:hypothetical protein
MAGVDDDEERSEENAVEREKGSGILSDRFEFRRARKNILVGTNGHHVCLCVWLFVCNSITCCPGTFLHGQQTNQQSADHNVVLNYLVMGPLVFVFWLGFCSLRTVNGYFSVFQGVYSSFIATRLKMT